MMIGQIVFAMFLAQVGGLQLQIEAPVQLRTVQAHLESFDSQRLKDVIGLVGSTAPQAPVRVILATESSDWARGVSPWVAGYALNSPELVVIFASRSPGYPHGTLDDVLRHEVAHVLIGRSSGGQTLPRWFNEGLAMAAEHGWRLEDQTQLLYQLVLGPRTSLRDLDRLFAGNQRDQTRAYALAGAFVRDVLRQHGSMAGAEILARLGRGMSFDAAFADVTGTTTVVAESQFWKRQRIWTTWIPIITSSATLWVGVTILALLAIRSHRRKNAAMEREWEEEEQNFPM